MSGENAALEGSYSAVLLDLSLPRQDGMKVLANLRRKGYTQPVLIVTARDQILERVVGSTPAPMTSSSSRSTCRSWVRDCARR